MASEQASKLAKLKLVGRGTGIFGLIVSLFEAIGAFLESYNVIQLILDITIILLTIDNQIAQNIDKLHDQTGLAFILTGLSTYGQIWLLLFIVKIASAPIMEMAVSDDMPKIPVYGVKALIFLMVMTPVVFIGQILGMMLEQGSVTLSDLELPWIGLITLIQNLPIMLEVLWRTAEVIILWVEFFIDIIPLVDMPEFDINPENTTLENQTIG